MAVMALDLQPVAGIACGCSQCTDYMIQSLIENGTVTVTVNVGVCEHRILLLPRLPLLRVEHWLLKTFEDSVEIIKPQGFTTHRADCRVAVRIASL